MTVSGGFLARSDSVGVGPVGGEALQSSDLDRRLVLAVHHARGLAEHLDRANAGATGSEDVLLEEGQGCRAGVACCDLGNEGGNIDVGRTGDGAGGGRVYAAALQAEVGLDERLLFG